MCYNVPRSIRYFGQNLDFYACIVNCCLIKLISLLLPSYLAVVSLDLNYNHNQLKIQTKYTNQQNILFFDLSGYYFLILGYVSFSFYKLPVSFNLFCAFSFLNVFIYMCKPGATIILSSTNVLCFTLSRLDG